MAWARLAKGISWVVLGLLLAALRRVLVVCWEVCLVALVVISVVDVLFCFRILWYVVGSGAQGYIEHETESQNCIAFM
ncbi:hypothetical protein B0T14DRAFT_518266 [Immersiella caudata]|uniref:Uncharacterized protein n=1 Tax=Immersiella caudata TaxID=314043 RepID=A0AA39WNZ8_9PEZI|nr:hypothetical protein B0T14DRAFT_518266 [Immersiella caudata]